MTQLSPKRPRIQLRSDDYRNLWRQILERDGWRCQKCGSTLTLQVHHILHRSQAGDDAEENLITLCSKCHSKAHQLAPQLHRDFYI